MDRDYLSYSVLAMLLRLGYALIGIAIALGIARLIDRKFFKEFDFRSSMEESSHRSVAAAIIYAAILIFMGLVMSATLYR